MTGPDIRAYMRTVAEYLQKNRTAITVVGVGGVLSTMVLGTRRSTHDVDIFCDSITPDQAKHLTNAIRKAAKKYKLSEHWLNNQTILHIQHSLRHAIQQDAIRQNCVVFEEAGLKMVAAPWMYSFASKLHRISGSGVGLARAYDPSDAANFLLKHLESQHQQTITVSDVKGWLVRYGITAESTCVDNLPASSYNDESAAI